MQGSRSAILAEARQWVEKSGLNPHDREELFALVSALTSTLEESALPAETDGLSVFLAASRVYIRALLSLLKQQTSELDALRKFSLNLTSSLDMPTVLELIAREALRLIPHTRAVHIYLYWKGSLEFGAALRSDGSTAPISTPRPNGLTYTVARSGDTIIVEDMRSHPLFLNASLEWSGSIIAIPLKMNQNIIGVMNLSRFVTGGFPAAEMRLLHMLADQAAVAISNASLLQMVSRKAYSDTVTGLPNRRALDERLEKEIAQARRASQGFAVVMMDLDGFKVVNDTYGHAVGDQVLRVFFGYMAQGLRSTDFLARYGGDELVLLMSQTVLPAVILVTDKIVEKMKQFRFTAPDGKIIRLGLSGGIAVYPLHGRTAPDLLRAADEALYRAKRHERGRFVVARGPTHPLVPLSLNGGQR